MNELAIDPVLLAADVKQFAQHRGFDLVGIAPAEPSRYRDYYRQWLDAGKAGSMHYLHERFDERTDPRTFLPGAKSIICVAKTYYTPLEASQHESPGKIARYALGDDYHDWLKDGLHDLADWLREKVAGVQTRCGTDTAPLMDKELAVRAGIGWLGKNTCVINHHAGSWLLLGEVLTTLELPPDTLQADHCGTCTRCLDACPTQAITAPYQLDATRCISYLTIEHREAIADDLQPAIGDWLFGCDICQEVCPWNRAPLHTLDPALQPRWSSGTLDAEAVSNWEIETYRQQLRHSAIKRVKLPQLQRNAEIVKQNDRRHRSHAAGQ